MLPDVSYSNNMTLSFWFNVADNSGTGYQYIYSHGTAATQNSLNVFLINSSTPAVTANDVLRTRILDHNDADNVDGLDVDLIALGLVDGNWHQYTLTTETGVGSSVYVDGVLQATIFQWRRCYESNQRHLLGQRYDMDSSETTTVNWTVFKFLTPH